MLAGNVAALLGPCIFVPALTYAFGPDNYNYESMQQICSNDDPDLPADVQGDLELVSGDAIHAADNVEEQRALSKDSTIAKITTVLMTLILLVLWPMPLYGTGYIFSKKFFTGWVSMGILWLFFSAFCVGLFPLWKGRHSITDTFKSIISDIAGKMKPRNTHAG